MKIKNNRKNKQINLDKKMMINNKNKQMDLGQMIKDPNKKKLYMNLKLWKNHYHNIK